MRKQTRPPEPDVLQNNATSWNQDWEQKKASGSKTAFSWHESRDAIVDALKDLNQEHCCFCDCFPMADRSNEPIEHFRPKSRFPAEAFTWANLYYICEACNTAKHEQWEDGLLRPDGIDYRFDRYFEFDYTNGAILPNSLATSEEQSRAEVTIRLYDLDHLENRRYRQLELRKWNQSKVDGRIIDEWGYRDYLEAP